MFQPNNTEKCYDVSSSQMSQESCVLPSNQLSTPPSSSSQTSSATPSTSTSGLSTFSDMSALMQNNVICDLLLSFDPEISDHSSTIAQDLSDRNESDAPIVPLGKEIINQPPSLIAQAPILSPTLISYDCQLPDIAFDLEACVEKKHTPLYHSEIDLIGSPIMISDAESCASENIDAIDSADSLLLDLTSTVDSIRSAADNSVRLQEFDEVSSDSMPSSPEACAPDNSELTTCSASSFNQFSPSLPSNSYVGVNTISYRSARETAIKAAIAGMPANAISFIQKLLNDRDVKSYGSPLQKRIDGIILEHAIAASNSAGTSDHYALLELSSHTKKMGFRSSCDAYGHFTPEYRAGIRNKSSKTLMEIGPKMRFKAEFEHSVDLYFKGPIILPNGLQDISGASPNVDPKEIVHHIAEPAMCASMTNGDHIHAALQQLENLQAQHSGNLTPGPISMLKNLRNAAKNLIMCFIGRDIYGELNMYLLSIEHNVSTGLPIQRLLRIGREAFNFLLSLVFVQQDSDKGGYCMRVCATHNIGFTKTLHYRPDISNSFFPELLGCFLGETGKSGLHNSKMRRALSRKVGSRTGLNEHTFIRVADNTPAAQKRHLPASELNAKVKK